VSAFRQAAATITSAPWRRAPLLLLRRPSVLISAAGACLVLAASMSAVPLFLSSAGTAALERQAAERCAAATGATLYATAEANAFADAAAATSAGRSELGPGIVTYLPLVTLSVTSTEGGSAWLSQLLSRTGALDHIEPIEVADVGSGGVWVPDRLAANLDINAGDQIAISSLGAPAVVPVAGVYRDLLSQTLDDFWCPLEPSLAATNPYGDLPPPPLLADEATFLDLSEQLDLGIGDGPPPPQWVTYEAPVIDELTLGEAADLTAFYRRWPGLIDDELGEVPHTGPPSLQSDLTFMTDRAEALQASIGGGIVPVAVAAVLASAGMVAAAAALWADRKHQELALLVARGIGPAAIGLKAALELLLAIVAGTVAGFLAAYASVRLFGPSSRLEPDAVTRAAVLALAGALLAAVLVAAVAAARSQARLREHARRRWRLAMVPWELGVVVLAVVSYHRLGRIGVPEVDGATVEGVDPLALAFPLLFLTASLAVVVRIGMPLLRRRRAAPATRPKHWAPYLARRRLAAGQAAAVTFFAASALSFGVLLYASTLTQSLTTTLDAKVRTFVGSDTVVQLAADADVPEPIAERTSRVERLGGTLDGSTVEVIAVDPSTFDDAAFWDATYADASLEELLTRLPAATVPTSPDESVAAIVIGDTDRSGSLELTGGDQPRSIEVAGTARLFPGATRGRPLLVMSQAEVDGFGEDVAATVEMWSKAGRQDVLDALAESDAQVVYTRSAEGIFDQTVFLTVTWTFGFMRSLGIVAGAIAVGGLAIYLDARRRARTLGYAFLRRMGLRPATHRRALLLEISATVLVGGAAGIVLAVAAGWLVHRQLDPVPSIPPGTLLRLPMPLLAAAVAIAVAVCVIGAFVAQRLADRDDPMEVLRAGA
jgi:putative ABC transport system permease protein